MSCGEGSVPHERKHEDLLPGTNSFELIAKMICCLAGLTWDHNEEDRAVSASLVYDNTKVSTQ